MDFDMSRMIALKRWISVEFDGSASLEAKRSVTVLTGAVPTWSSLH
jgi:hypothetical protein